MAKLASSWTYYQLANSGEQTQKSWADSMKTICTVSTEEELLYTLDEVNTIGLDSINDLNFFKGSIQPMWEDPSNVNGGRLIAEINVGLKDTIDALWNQTIAFCSLEAFEGINGCVFNEKSNYRICIWLSDPRHSDDVLRSWKEVLDCPSAVFSFSLHNKYSDFSKSKKKYSNRK